MINAGANLPGPKEARTAPETGEGGAWEEELRRDEGFTEETVAAAEQVIEQTNERAAGAGVDVANEARDALRRLDETLAPATFTVEPDKQRRRTRRGPNDSEKPAYDSLTLHEAAHAYIAALLDKRVKRIYVSHEEASVVNAGTDIWTRIGHQDEYRIIGNAGFAAEAVFWRVWAPGDSGTDRRVYDPAAMERAQRLVAKFRLPIQRLAEHLFANEGEVAVQPLYDQGLLPNPLTGEERAELGI